MDKNTDPSFLNFLWLRGAQCCQQLSDQGMSRSLFCHGLDSSREQPHQMLLCPSEAAQMQPGDNAWTPSKGCVSLHSIWGINGPWDALLLSFFCLLFSIAVCSERKKKVNQLQWFQQSFTQLVQMQVFKCQACFNIIQLHEQQRKEPAIQIFKQLGKAKQREGQKGEERACRCRREKKVNSVCRTLLSWMYSFFPGVFVLLGFFLTPLMAANCSC